MAAPDNGVFAATIKGAHVFVFKAALLTILKTLITISKEKHRSWKVFRAGSIAFDQSPQYWLNLQATYNLKTAEASLGKLLDDVHCWRMRNCRI